MLSIRTTKLLGKPSAPAAFVTTVRAFAGKLLSKHLGEIAMTRAEEGELAATRTRLALVPRLRVKLLSLMLGIRLEIFVERLEFFLSRKPFPFARGRSFVGIDRSTLDARE